MKTQSKLFYTYLLFVVTYALLTLLPTPDKTILIKYHLQATSLRVLDLSVLIPSVVMWYAIFYGYSKLRCYSQIIGKNQDGKQVSKLANGLFVLTIGIPISTLVSTVLSLTVRSHPRFAGPSTIISNYGTVIVALLAFLFINKGARALNSLAKSRPGFAASHAVVITVIVIGVIFCDLIAREHKNLHLTYHMSYSLIMLTLAIPYMYIWFLGLYAIAEMYEYSKQVAGVVYRKSWNRLAFGLGSIIVVNILLQYLGTLATWLNGLSLANLLLLLYVLLLLLATAFIVVALGTRELMKIEEA